MNMLKSLITKEENRNKNMIEEYKIELMTLPKGSIRKKKIKNHIYYYLVFREKDKVISKYIGKDEKTILLVKEKLVRRKQIEEILKKLNEEKMQINKLEALL